MSRETANDQFRRSDEVWRQKSCQCWSTSRVGHVDDFCANAAGL